MRRLVAVLALVLALPSVAQEEPAWAGAPIGDLVRRLGSSKVGDRILAARFLRQRGEEGRLALVRFLAPDLAPPVEAAGGEGRDEALAARIEKLVDALGADAYEDREGATSALAAIGAPAAPFLRRALESPDQEVRERARRLLDGIEGPAEGEVDDRSIRVEALAALVAFADPESIPVFRRLLVAEDPRLVRLADAGLRMVGPAWPDPPAGGEKRSNEELLEAWDVALETPIDRTAAAIDVAPSPLDRFPAGRTVEGRTASRFEFSLGGEMGALLGGAGGDATLRFSVEARFSEGADPDGDPPALVRKYEAYEMKTEIPGMGAGGGAANGPDLTGKTIRLPLAGGPPTDEHGEALPSRSEAMIDRGQAMLSFLPPGSLAPGDAFPIDGFDRGSSPIPFLAEDASTSKILDGTGRVLYLGDRRFRFAYSMAVDQDQASARTIQRMWLAGEATIGEDGRVVAYRFEGPWYAETKQGVEGGMDMTLDGRIESNYSSVE